MGWLRVSASSIRFRLLGGLLLALLVCSGGGAWLLVGMTATALDGLSSDIEARLGETATEVEEDLAGQVPLVAEAYRTLARDSGASLARLLALVAPDSYLSYDYMALDTNVVALNQDPQVVYAVYLDARGAPATTYLDPAKPPVAALIQAAGGQTELGAVIGASRRLDDYLVISEPVFSGKTQLGEVVVCLSTVAVRAESDRLRQEIAGVLETTRKRHGGLTERIAQQRDGLIRSLRFGILGGAAVFLAVVCLTAFSIITATLKRLGRVASMLEDISEGDGDLRARLNLSGKDELGQLASSFDRFVDKIQTVVIRVKQASDELASMATEQSAATAQMATSNSEIAAQTATFATATEEMSATVEKVAQNTASVSDAAGQARQVAIEGAQVVSQAVAALAEIAAVVGGAAETVTTLGASSERIGTVVQVIEDIADQTNLLALNAAIEAARAGEHGRGFAVVADEVRKLAEKTVKATKEIAETIQEVQAQGRHAVNAMEDGRQKVITGTELGTRAGKTIRLVQEAVVKASDQTEQIAAAIEELSVTIRDMALNMEHIATGVRGTEAAIQNISASAQVVSAKADDLKGVAERFQTA
ncbi:MAG: methyl-accepting chemotaxis protein [Thermodesulfobacteriota bacterium]